MDLSRLERPAVALVLLLVVSGFLFLARLGSLPLLEPDEARYAEVAREMAESGDLGDWITPRSNYVRYLAKPPLLFWMTAASFRVLGVTEPAARLPIALVGVAGVLLCYWFGRRAFGARAGLFASLVLATSVMYFAAALQVRFDLPLTVLVTLTLFAFWRARWQPRPAARTALYGLGYLSASLATLMKGPVGVALPAVVLVLHLWWSGTWWQWRQMRLWLGGLVFLLVAVPWFAVAEWHNPGYLRYFLLTEHLRRYFVPGSFHSDPLGPFYYIPMLVVFFLPWTAFLPAAVVAGWRGLAGPGGGRAKARGGPATPLLSRLRQALLRARARQTESPAADALSLCMLWASVTILVFSFSLGSKLPVYVLPAWPALALLVGKLLADITKERSGTEMARGVRVSYGVFLLSLSAVGIGGALFVRTSYDLPREVAGPYEAAAIASAMLGIVLTVGALLARMRSTAFALMVLVTGGVFVALAGLLVPVGDAHSVKRPMELVRRVLAPGDMVATYVYTAHGAPFYLRRPVVYVSRPDRPPQAAFDPAEARAKGLWITEEELLEFASGPVPLYGLTRLKDRQLQLGQLQKQLGTDVSVFASPHDLVLFANRAGARKLAEVSAAGGEP